MALKDPAPCNWLDEGRITANSYPYLEVTFGQSEDMDKDPPKGATRWPRFTISSEFYKNATQNDKMTGGAGIIDAEIEGFSPGARNGHISIIDPTGAWASAIQKITSQDYSMMGYAPGANIHLTYGWKYLALGPNMEGKQDRDYLAHLDALYLDSAFDLTDDGVMTVKINFVEFASRIVDMIKFSSPDDMMVGNTHSLFDGGKSDIKDHVPQNLMKYLLNTDSQNTSAAKALFKHNVEIVFLGANETKEMNKDKWPDIRFSTTLTSWINALTSIMERKDAPASSSPEKFTYSYEKFLTIKWSKNLKNSSMDAIAGKIGDLNLKEGFNYVFYDWRASPEDAGDTKDQNSPIIPNAMIMWAGPTLLYKGMRKKGSEKVLLGWTSDLSSYPAILQLLGTTLNSTMKTYVEDDWKNLESALNKGYIENNTSKHTTPYIASQTAAYAVGDGGAGEVDTQAALKMINSLGSSTDQQNGAMLSMNSNAQIRSVIRNNLFNATATIMGDPSMGYLFIPMSSVLVTDFSAVSALASDFFSRGWYLGTSTHKFEAGKYTTELKIVGFPSVNSPVGDKDAEKLWEMQHT